MLCAYGCARVTLLFIFFFFKQKTAYEMRISDWSSDVCSSDLLAPLLETDRWFVYSTGAWLAMLYNATVCFVFCYWAWNTLVRILPAGISGLSTLMIPVVGVFSSMVVLGEQPQWPEFAALALVAVALGLILKPARAQTV